MFRWLTGLALLLSPLSCGEDCIVDIFIPPLDVNWPQEPAAPRHVLSVGGSGPISRVPLVEVSGGRVDYPEVRHLGSSVWLIPIEADGFGTVTVTVSATVDGREEPEVHAKRYEVRESLGALSPTIPTFSKRDFDGFCGLEGGTSYGPDDWNDRLIAWFVRGERRQVLQSYTRLGAVALKSDDRKGCVTGGVVTDTGEIIEVPGCIEKAD